MLALANAICGFLLKYFENRLAQDQSANVRVGLVGLPDQVLEEVFNQLTNGQTKDVDLEWGESKFKVPVLLIANDPGKPETPTSVLSRRCSWDYAVGVRNSSALLLLLIPNSAGDTMPESLANAIEIVGQLDPSRRRRIFRDLLWQATLSIISEELGIDRNNVETALQYAAESSSDLPPDRRNDVLWRAADSLLDSDSVPLSSTDKLTYAVGLPFIGESDASIADAAKVLKRLGKLIGAEGLSTGIDRLKSTPTAAGLLLNADLDAFVDHIRKRGALSGATFERSPSIYYQPTTPTDGWWKVLDVSTLEQLVEDLGGAAPAQLILNCSNALKDSWGMMTTPSITLSTVELRAESAELDEETPAVSFRRRIGRQSSENLVPNPEAPLTCIDASPPTHDRTYGLTAVNDSCDLHLSVFQKSLILEHLTRILPFSAFFA